MKRIDSRSELNINSIYLFNDGATDQKKFRVISLDPTIDIKLIPTDIDSFIVDSDITDGFIYEFETLSDKSQDIEYRVFNLQIKANYHEYRQVLNICNNLTLSECLFENNKIFITNYSSVWRKNFESKLKDFHNKGLITLFTDTSFGGKDYRIEFTNL